MANIKVKIIDQNTLCLEEDAKKGDIIDLKTAISIDTAFIQRLIEEEKTKLVDKKLQEQKSELEKLFNANISKIKAEYEAERDKKIQENANSYDAIVNSLKLDKAKLEEKIESNKVEAKNNLELELAKEKNLHQNEIESLNNNYLKNDFEQKRLIQELQNQLNSQKESRDKDIQIEKSKVENDFKDKLIEKDKLISDSKRELELLKVKGEKDLLEKENEIKKVHDEEIKKLQDELQEAKAECDKLSLAKSFQNVKKLGEELEKWCTQEYENAAVAGFTNCTWQKDNDAIKEALDEKGTKADFIFKVFSDTPSECTFPISSVCLEMKNESNVSVNKKKNSDHYKKLDEDRKKKGCEYALLVSELEWDTANDSPIKKVNEYEKMFVVRPQYMITFLSIVYSLSTKYSEIINAKNKEALNLKESQELIEEFESLKKTYLEKPLETLAKQIEEINKNNDKIIEVANKNRDVISKLINDTLSTIQLKIERFNIRKLVKMRDKISD